MKLQKPATIKEANNQIRTLLYQAVNVLLENGGTARTTHDQFHIRYQDLARAGGVSKEKLKMNIRLRNLFDEMFGPGHFIEGGDDDQQVFVSPHLLEEFLREPEVVRMVAFALNFTERRIIAIRDSGPAPGSVGARVS